MRIFIDYVHVKFFWEKLQAKFHNNVILPPITPQTAILGLYNEVNDKYYLLSHILLIFKYIYIPRKKGILNIDILCNNCQLTEAAIQRCSKNMQQIYRRTPIPKYNFNKVPLQLY